MDKIKGFIFDWSGTISNDIFPVYKANIAVLQHFKGMGMSFEEWRLRASGSAVAFFRSMGIILQEANDELLERMYKSNFDRFILEHQPTMYDGVPEVLKHLSRGNNILAVLSSHPPENLEAEARRYGIFNFFKLLRGGVRDKTIALSDLCKQLGIGLEQVIYLGDTVFDIDAARDAGCKSGAVCWGYHPKKRLMSKSPDLLLERLNELVDYF